MNILLSNDDGYSADGIRILEEVLSSSGHCIYVCAPDRQQSGKSHSMTISGHVHVTEYGPRHYHLSGTPADCIVYSHRCSLFPVPFDAVISGINHGYNLSSDIIYSGTCAAARQASFYGMKAIAISAEDGGDEGLFRKAASFLSGNLETFLASIPADAFMNINVPSAYSGEWEKGGIGNIVYNDSVAVRARSGASMTLEIEAADLEYRPSMSLYRADHEICRSGKASVTIVDSLPVISSAMERL